MLIDPRGYIHTADQNLTIYTSFLRAVSPLFLNHTKSTVNNKTLVEAGPGQVQVMSFVKSHNSNASSQLHLVMLRSIKQHVTLHYVCKHIALGVYWQEFADTIHITIQGKQCNIL